MVDFGARVARRPTHAWENGRCFLGIMEPLIYAGAAILAMSAALLAESQHPIREVLYQHAVERAFQLRGAPSARICISASRS